MKKFLLLSILLFALYSCDKKSKIEKAVEEIPVDMKVDRFDKAFYETPVKDLSKLKAEYPFFFPQGVDDKVWIDKMQNPMWRELYQEVEKKYLNIILKQL